MAKSTSSDIRLNRYMSIDKFAQLIINKKLWFNKLNNFSDKHEGRANVNWKNETPEIIRRWRDRFACNCWNCDDDENFALWNIYLNKQTDGVCVVSSLEKLKTNFENPGEYINGYFINYVNYGNNLDSFSPLQTVTTKYIWYNYENEFRFIINIKNNSNGILISIEPESIIDKVILSPNISNEGREKVFKLMSKINLENSISESIIMDKI